MNAKYKTKDGAISSSQKSKGKTKLKLHQKISDFYDHMNYILIKTFMFEKDPAAKSEQNKDKILEAAMLLMKILQTKPQIKNEIMKQCD